MQPEVPDGGRSPRLSTAYLLAVFLGVFGAHWFYLRQPARGTARLSLTVVAFLAAFTGLAGLLGVIEIAVIYIVVSLSTVFCWVVGDAFLIPRMVRQYNLLDVDSMPSSERRFFGIKDSPTKTSLRGAYLRWVLGGAFGGHRYYLARNGAATLCTITGTHLSVALLSAAFGGNAPAAFLLVGGALLVVSVLRVLLVDLFTLPGEVRGFEHQAAPAQSKEMP